MTTKPIPTSVLTGAALDWAVAKANGIDLDSWLGDYLPSTDWAQGGPIIEREEISTAQNADTKEWLAGIHGRYGVMRWPSPTPLIAAMRCYVAYKLGPTVDVPEELAP